MNEIFVNGIGAVSPAGWTVEAMREALLKGEPLPVKHLPHPAGAPPLRVRVVPPFAARPDFLTHARLRRSSAISQFAVSAAVEAVGPDVPKIRDNTVRLGIIFCVMAGCVNYSRRFYDESLRDPATASPLVFPETVFNAPASHLAAFLGTTRVSYTLVGDPGMFLTGLAMGAEWLLDAQVDRCLIVGAEEVDWMVADVSRRFERKSVLSEGAGAVYLSTVPAHGGALRLAAITDAHSYLRRRGPAQAAATMRAQLPACSSADLLCDGVQGIPKLDAAELCAWADWRGPRLSPKTVLGEGLAAFSAWQCVAALDALSGGGYSSATVSVVGCNQQAIGARFTKNRHD